MDHGFGVISNNLCLTQDHKDFLLILYNFRFTMKSMVYFELPFVYGVMYGSKFR